MDDDEIKNQIQRAITCVEGIDPTYRKIAFQIVLERLLSQEKDSEKELRGSLEMAPIIQEKYSPINEFYSALHIKAYTDGVIAIAYYLLHAEKISLFTIQEITERLARCRAERPRNLSDVLSGCARNGWLAEGNEKRGGMKTWYLTSTGEKYFEIKIKSAATGL